MLGDTAEHATAISARSVGCSPIATLHSTSTSANRATWILEPRAIDSARPTLFFIALPGRPVLTVLLSVLFSSQAAGDGRSDWLKGAQLLAVYLVLGLTYFFIPDTAP